MSKYEHRAIPLSVLAAAAGLALAFHFKAGHWFGRAGAIITAIAVIFAALELRERVGKATVLAAEEFQRSCSELLKQGEAASLNQSSAEAAVVQVEAEVRAEVAKAARQASRRLLRVEVFLLVIGTLVWGFGDLPLDGLFRRQAANPSIERTSSSGLRPLPAAAQVERWAS